jgi:peroxiredoxin
MGCRPTSPGVPGQDGEAPSFMLPDGPMTRLGLSDFTGRWLVVPFHVADWDPVAESQLRSLSSVAADLRDRGIDIVSVSSDTVWSHAAFARSARIAVPLLADDDPLGAVASAYGTGPGREASALFLIDPDRQIRWSQLVDRRVDPGVDGLLSAIEGLSVQSDAERLRGRDRPDASVDGPRRGPGVTR